MKNIWQTSREAPAPAHNSPWAPGVGVGRRVLPARLGSETLGGGHAAEHAEQPLRTGVGASLAKNERRAPIACAPSLAGVDGVPC